MSRPSDNTTARSLPARMLGWITATVAARPRLMLWLILLVACASVGVTVTQLQLRTSRADLMNPASQFATTWKQYSDVFSADSELTVVIETATPNKKLIQTAIDDLGQRLKREPELFDNVLSRVDMRTVRRKALQFLTEGQLRRTADRLQGFNGIIQQNRWSELTVDKLANRLARDIARGKQEGVVPESTYRGAEELASSLSRYLGNAQATGKRETSAFDSPIPDLMQIAADQKLTDDANAYVMNGEGTVAVIHVTAVRSPATALEDPRARSIARLRELMKDVQKTHQTESAGLTVSLTGIPALESDEMRSTSIDMRNAGIVAFFLVGGMLFVTFRGVRHPMLSLLTLVVAMAWTFGAATLVVGHLNIISVCFAIFLIGLGVDFSVSFINRYLTLRQELYELPDALRETAETTGAGILTSAITTALAFSTAIVTGFPGLAELGVISAMGVLLCALATFLFLPALIALSDNEYEVDALPQPFSPIFLRRILVAWPSVSIAVGVGILLLFGSQAFYYRDGALHCRVGYDQNLMRLQNPHAEAVRAETRIESTGTESSLYAVSIAPSKEDALALRNRFMALGSVDRVSDLASKLSSPTDASVRQLMLDVQRSASSVSPQLPSLPAASLGSVGRALDALYVQIKDAPNPTAKRAAEKLDLLLDHLVAADKTTRSREEVASVLTSYNDMIAAWLLREYQQIASADNFNSVSPRDLPREIVDRYVRLGSGNEEYWALRIYPKGNAWDGETLTRFVDELRTVDPNVTGIPVQNLESAGRMHHTYATIGLYAIAVIAIVLLMNYLRPGQKLLTVVPPIAVAAFIGYTLFKRNGTFDPSLLVMICLGLVVFIAAVLDYRNLRDTLLTLVPAFAGGVVMLGAMAMLGLQLNPVNLIALPLVFAIGIDNGIYLVADCRKQIASGKETFEPSADTLSSVLVTSLTSIVGFGSLMIAAHQGLFSIGLVLALGVASSLLVSLLLMPPVLVLVATHQPASMEPVRMIRKPESEAAGKESQAKANGQAKAKKAA
jgi:predicted RND superfamily exporter protein